MRVVISRRLTDKQTTGCLYVFNEDRAVYNCKTIELPFLDNIKNESCIPEGRYNVRKIVSQHYGKCFIVDDVPERDSILIHVGNYASGSKVDTKGCILVGLRFADINQDGNLDVADSRKAMNLLLEVLPKKFILDIFNPLPSIDSNAF